MEKSKKTKAEWKEILKPEVYNIAFEHGTERAFSGELTDNKEIGTYECAVCEASLFKSDAKYDSGSGWPSFYECLDPAAITEKVDNSLFMKRTEVLCSCCDAHLGHVFPDGPKPTGNRYCINSLVLKFQKD